MKRLLIIAPAFPPHPSPATHRARFLVGHAAKFGWSAEVASVHPDNYVEPLDAPLARLLPSDLRVSYSSALSAGWTRRVGFGDLGLRSYASLARLVRQICAERPPDLIFTSGPPFYTFLIAARMRREFGIPFIADYTDPWIHPLSPENDRPTRKAYWANRLALALEPRVVRAASHLLAVSEATHDGVRARHPDIPRSRFGAIPFGFEESDFDAALSDDVFNPVFSPADGLLHVVYVGAVPPSMAETVRALLASVRALDATQPELMARTRIHFVGTSYDPNAPEGLVTRLARAAGLSERVTEMTGRVPYLSALRVMREADVVLALGSVDRHYTASKIFNCLLAGPPVVTVFHEESPVVGIVANSGAGGLVTYGDEVRVDEKISAIATALEAALLERQAGTARPRSLSAIASYSAEAMTKRILETGLAALGADAGRAVRAEAALAHD